MPKNKIALILYKEWLDLRHQRGFWLGTLLPPLVFAVLPFIIAYGVGHAEPGTLHGLSSGSTPPIPGLKGMSDQEMAQAIVGMQFSILFLLLPVIIPSIVASYSIVGEKTNRTLEPILATPVSTSELLLAKNLAALAPALAATLLSGALFVAEMAIASVSQRVFTFIVSPAWILILLLCSPLLALITTAATVAISSRVNDPRTAQQISAVVIIPVMLLFGGQISGLLVISPLFVVGMAAVLGVIAGGMVWLDVRLFQREVILTRWT